MNLHFMGKNPATNPPSSADWENLGTAIAQNSMVLLKNENNILPLNKTTLSSIAIIGPQSKKYIGWKEGEDYQTSLSFADGIRLAKKETTALYTSNALLSPYENMEKNGYFTNDSLLHSGIYTTYYNDTALSKPLYCKIEPQGNFSLEDNQGLMFTTAVIPEMTGDYTFFLEGSDGLKLEVNQEVLIHQWKDTTHRLVKATLSLKAGEVYQLKGTHYQKNGGTPLRMGYYLLGMGVNYQEAIESAKKSEVAIVCVGYDIPSESDGRAFALPHEQEKLVKDICRVNKNTIVVLTGGGSIDMMSWKDSARAVIHTFYPGCYAGTALANILFGEYNPSARLPFSYERKFSDNPIAPYHQDSNHDKKVVFEEGLRLGYRNYVSDEDAAPPLFPFGFGLSYTSFIYTNLTISPNNYTGEGVVTVSFDVSNVGKVKGTDVPQLYIRDPQASVVRPERELKGWTKVTLNAGETQHVSISLTAEQLAFYRPEHKQWSAENGVFEAQIGKNALDISLKAPFYYSGERVYVRTKRRRK
jgi:beta-glucosidase